MSREVKVWLELGFEDGESLAWRAQVFEGRSKAVSRIGVGPSSGAALDDCVALYWADNARQEREAAAVTWWPLPDAP